MGQALQAVMKVAYFCLHSGAHNWGDYFGKNADWSIRGWFFCQFLVWFVAWVAEEEPATCSAAGFGFG